MIMLTIHQTFDIILTNIMSPEYKPSKPLRKHIEILLEEFATSIEGKAYKVSVQGTLYPLIVSKEGVLITSSEVIEAIQAFEGNMMLFEHSTTRKSKTKIEAWEGEIDDELKIYEFLDNEIMSTSRIQSALYRAGFKTAKQIQELIEEKSPDSLLAIRGIGEKSLKIILDRFGIEEEID